MCAPFKIFKAEVDRLDRVGNLRRPALFGRDAKRRQELRRRLEPVDVREDGADDPRRRVGRVPVRARPGLRIERLERRREKSRVDQERVHAFVEHAQAHP